MYSYVVMIIPSGRFVSVLHGSYRVLCTSTDSIARIQWLVNGTLLEDLNLDETTNIDRTQGFGVLSFGGNLQSRHNNSNIKCKVTTNNMEILTSADSSELIIQGKDEVDSTHLTDQ